MNLHLRIVEYSCALLRGLYGESVRRSVRREAPPILNCPGSHQRGSSPAWLPGTYGITNSADLPQSFQTSAGSTAEDLSEPDPENRDSLTAGVYSRGKPEGGVFLVAAVITRCVAIAPSVAARGGGRSERVYSYFSSLKSSR